MFYHLSELAINEMLIKLEKCISGTHRAVWYAQRQPMYGREIWKSDCHFISIKNSLALNFGFGILNDYASVQRRNTQYPYSFLKWINLFVIFVWSLVRHSPPNMYISLILSSIACMANLVDVFWHDRFS